MKVKPLAAGGIAAAFVGSIAAAQFGQGDGHFHLPPGNAPITALATSTAGSTMTFAGSFVPFNAIHDADYSAAPDTTPLKSDGQVDRG